MQEQTFLDPAAETWQPSCVGHPFRWDGLLGRGWEGILAIHVVRMPGFWQDVCDETNSFSRRLTLGGSGESLRSFKLQIPRAARVHGPEDHSPDAAGKNESVEKQTKSLECTSTCVPLGSGAPIEFVPPCRKW